MGEELSVFERLTQWSIARTAILRAIGSVRRQPITPQEGREAVENALLVVDDLRAMADAIEADVEYIARMADDFLQDDTDAPSQ